MTSRQTGGQAVRGKHMPDNSTSVGTFDYVPRLGYKEYWYPALEANLVKKKPVSLTMLGEELIFFRDKENKVVALTDYCPHRGARLSGGVRRTGGAGPAPGRHNDEFPGYITCTYHGYTFDGEGMCVASLGLGPNNPLVGKMRARKYPTEELKGIVFVWMGETEPVPLKEDLPAYFYDDGLVIETYVRRWDFNWSLSIENANDSHVPRVHRGSFRKALNGYLFLKRPAYEGIYKVVEEGDNFIQVFPYNRQAAETSYYVPDLGKKWPQHTWWMFLTRRGAGSRGRMVGVDTERPGGLYMLPCWTTPGAGAVNVHLRAAVPVTEDTCRMWTFTITRKSNVSGWRRLQWMLYYNLMHIYSMGPQAINEFEDMPIQSVGCLDPDRPQMLGPTDNPLIFWRRRMPFKSRDAQRLWGDQGTADLVKSARAEELKAQEDPYTVSEQAKSPETDLVAGGD